MNVFKKALASVLIVSTLISQPGIFSVVSAQEATRSAETIPPELTPTLFADPVVLSPAESSPSGTPSPSIDPSPTSAPSATIRQKVRIRPFGRHSFRASEIIDVVLESDPAAEFSATVADNNGATAGIIAEVRESEGQRMIRLRPSGKLTPGKYTLTIRDWTGNVTQETFSWGLVSVNTDKASYIPGDRATLRINVLNETGTIQCGKPVSVSIAAPDGKTESFSTENGSVRSVPECNANSVTPASGYETEYVFSSSGMYRLTVTGRLSSGDETVEDSIAVRDQAPFVVSRARFPDRIQQGQSIETVVSVTSKESFDGVISETVPSVFSVASASATPYTLLSSATMTEDEIKDSGIDPRRIRYPFDGRYPVTLTFGEKVADPDQKILYETFGLAGHDGIDFGLPKGTNVMAADDGVVALAGSGVYGITVVIQHSWGRTYYGHLSGTGLNVGKKVLKGESLGLSGDTGLSTGPHLHFGLKLTGNDPDNGYYGKIDPAPFLSGKTLEDGYPVRVIGWNISMKAGETKELRYRFTAPDTRPQTYLVGPVRIGGAKAEDGDFEMLVDRPEEEQVQGVSTKTQEETGITEKSVITKRKKNNPVVKETAIGASYQWEAEISSKTVFSFGRRNGTGVFPEVRIRQKDGWFLSYSHKKLPGPVIPDAKNNRVEWQGAPGVTDRYTALEDRIKADYIVGNRQAVANNRLDFFASFNHGLPADGESIEEAVLAGKGKMTPELIPGGDIVWMGEDWGEVFRNPKPVVTDSSGKALTAAYELKKEQDGTATVSIVLQKDELDTAAYPVTVDPVTIDSAATATATAYANGRKLLRDPYGNLIVLSDAGTGNDNVYYKNYNATTWTDANVDLDGGAGSALEIAADIDGQANNESVHVAFRNSTDSDISYCKLAVTRNANNEITGIGSCSIFDIDTSDKSARPSLVIANKGEGAGKEKVALIWAVNGTGGGKRGDIRFLQCDVADNCGSASYWWNASEMKNAGIDGISTSVTSPGAADVLFQAGTAGDKHHGVITQVPGRPARTPTGAYKDINGTPTTLTNALDDNTGTTADINSLTTTDYLYVGDTNKFSRIVFDITNTNSNAQTLSTKQYCSANSDTGTSCDTWSSLANFIDNAATATVAINEDGSILFDEPSTWIASTENGTQGFWTRLRPSGALDSTVSIAEIDVSDRHIPLFHRFTTELN